MRVAEWAVAVYCAVGAVGKVEVGGAWAGADMRGPGIGKGERGVAVVTGAGQAWMKRSRVV